MNELKKYSFRIKTLRYSLDENSPHCLANFEFLALDIESAEKYRKSLIDHYDSNKPFSSKIPWEYTELEESEY